MDFPLGVGTALQDGLEESENPLCLLSPDDRDWS